MSGRYLELLAEPVAERFQTPRSDVTRAATPWRNEIGRAIVGAVLEAEARLDVQVPVPLEQRLDAAWGDEALMTRVAEETVNALHQLVRLRAETTAGRQGDEGVVT